MTFEKQKPQEWPVELLPTVSRLKYRLPHLLEEALRDAEFKAELVGLLLKYNAKRKKPVLRGVGSSALPPAR